MPGTAMLLQFTSTVAQIACQKARHRMCAPKEYRAFQILAPSLSRLFLVKHAGESATTASCAQHQHTRKNVHTNETSNG